MLTENLILSSSEFHDIWESNPQFYFFPADEWISWNKWERPWRQQGPGFALRTCVITA